MLLELRVRNFTIIDDLTLSFSPGLNVLTGETGAGKSIIVDALGIITGDKASQDLIRTGKSEALIEASFDQRNHPLLGELSIDSDEGIIIRRTISSQGKGKSYINDTAVSLQTLSRVGESLIQIHGQHEQQDLLKKESHLSFIDAFGGLEEELSSLRGLFHEVAQLRDEVAQLSARLSERAQRTDFLTFQIQEINSASLREGEREELEGERAILHNLTRLKDAAETAYGLLYASEDSCLDSLSKVLARLREMAQIDQETGEVLEALEPVLPQMEDAAALLRRVRDRYEVEPGRIDEVEERLELIRRLEKKYGGSVAEVLAFRERAGEELKGLELADGRLGSLEAGLSAKEEELLRRAETLSGRRVLAAGEMAGLVVSELRDLGFQKAVFTIAAKRKGVSADGIDDVEFLFSANPGEPSKPLARVASGGELSRIMLALKCVSLKGRAGVQGPGGKGEGHEEAEFLTGPLPLDPGPLSPVTLIFDEVDAGIGGVAAGHVGQRLKSVAGLYQVLCITHLPQIAALADSHLKVEKAAHGESVRVTIEALTGEERMRELARMLSGRVTEASLSHARELLELTKESPGN